MGPMPHSLQDQKPVYFWAAFSPVKRLGRIPALRFFAPFKGLRVLLKPFQGPPRSSSEQT